MSRTIHSRYFLWLTIFFIISKNNWMFQHPLLHSLWFHCKHATNIASQIIVRKYTSVSFKWIYLACNRLGSHYIAKTNVHENVLIFYILSTIISLSSSLSSLCVCLHFISQNIYTDCGLGYVVYVFRMSHSHIVSFFIDLSLCWFIIKSSQS